MTELRYPNGVTETLAWNADDSLQRLSHKNGASTLAQSTYTYDGLGRRKTLQETVSGLPTLTYTYQYDPLDRLTQVDNGTASQKQTYAYDIFGNRVQKQLGNPVSQTTAYQYDPAQQLTEVRNGSLTGTLLEADLYDEVGQLTQKCTGGTVTRPNDSSCSGSQVTQYAWTSFDRLGQISGSTNASFRYDDQGRRIQKTEGGAVTNYLYDGPNLYGEYAGAGWTTPTALYVQAGLDHPLARLTGSVGSPSATAVYYHPDGLGSLLALTNVTAAVTATQRFDAFGLKLAGSGTVPTYGYTGREPDASGLVYYRARYYDPSVGRFTQRDPVGYLDGINRYAYVGNNPVNLTDPQGLTAQGPLGIQFASQNGSYYSGGQGVLDPAGSGYGGYGYGPVPFANTNWPSGPPVSLAGGIRQTANPFLGSTFTGERYHVAVNTPNCPEGPVGCGGSSIGGGSGFGGIGGGGAARALSGRAAEGAVSNSLGIPRNVGPGRETIPGSGPGGYRVPDFPPSVTIQQRGSIIEVKDTQSLSITPQLRDLGEYAERNNLIIELYTNARLPQSGELHRLIDRGVIIPKPIPSK